jgi:hypothetical protein
MSSCAMRPPIELPILASNREWITCGVTIVAVRKISFIRIMDNDKICVTLRDRSTHYTRPLTPAEQADVLRLLYGTTTRLHED